MSVHTNWSILYILFGCWGSRMEALLYTSMKNIFKQMFRDVGMAVPKTTEIRHGGGSVQARQSIEGLHK